SLFNHLSGSLRCHPFYWQRVKQKDSCPPSFDYGSCRDTKPGYRGGEFFVEPHKVAISSNRERWHACISAWVARCDGCPGSVVLLQVSLLRVFPKRGERVGLAGFCVNASLSRHCISIDLWSCSYRQD